MVNGFGEAAIMFIKEVIGRNHGEGMPGYPADGNVMAMAGCGEKVTGDNYLPVLLARYKRMILSKEIMRFVLLALVILLVTCDYLFPPGLSKNIIQYYKQESGKQRKQSGCSDNGKKERKERVHTVLKFSN
jgi:hypothetical protein